MNLFAIGFQMTKYTFATALTLATIGRRRYFWLSPYQYDPDFDLFKEML
jgi:hypothetical protein